VREALAAEIDRVARYPETTYSRLRSDLADYVGGGVTPDHIVVGNGSDGLIELVVKSFGGPGRRAFVPVPTFFVYSRTARAFGLQVVEVARDADFGVSPAKLAAACRPQDVIFLANPNNPTGNAVPIDVVAELAGRAAGLVVADECYYEMWGETALGLVAERSNVLVLRTLSKTFALAGLRVGYCVAPAATAKALELANQTFPVNRLAVAAARAALASRDYYMRELEAMAGRRERLAEGLRGLGLDVSPSVTNFLFVSWAGIERLRMTDVVGELAARKVYVANFSLAPGLGRACFRTAVGTDEENEVLLAALSEIASPRV